MQILLFSYFLLLTVLLLLLAFLSHCCFQKIILFSTHDLCLLCLQLKAEEKQQNRTKAISKNKHHQYKHLHWPPLLFFPLPFPSFPSPPFLPFPFSPSFFFFLPFPSCPQNCRISQTYLRSPQVCWDGPKSFKSMAPKTTNKCGDKNWGRICSKHLSRLKTSEYLLQLINELNNTVMLYMYGFNGGH